VYLYGVCLMVCNTPLAGCSSISGQRLLKKCLIYLFRCGQFSFFICHAHRHSSPTLSHSISRVIRARGGKAWREEAVGILSVREAFWGGRGDFEGQESVCWIGWGGGNGDIS